MSKKIIFVVIDADVAKSAGLTEHPISSSSRIFLQNMKENGHKAVMCKKLLHEWNKHNSKFAKTWLSSMFAKKLVLIVEPNQQVAKLIESSDLKAKEKNIAQKDVHLVDAALTNDDKVISSNDITARDVFGNITKLNKSIADIAWFSPTLHNEFLCRYLKKRCSIPKTYFLVKNGVV